MNQFYAQVVPLFPSDPMEWETPLELLGWDLERGHSPWNRGTICPARDPGSGLGLIMGDFRHRETDWHAVALKVGRDNHPESLVLWGWSQILGKDLYDLAEGGVCIANGPPGRASTDRAVYVLFKAPGSGKTFKYVRRPRTVEGFPPGTVISEGCVSAPGSFDSKGNVFGLYRRRGGQWHPTTVMVSPCQLPELPAEPARQLRRGALA